MLRHLLLSVWERKLINKMILIQHAFRCRIFLIEVHICAMFIVSSIILHIRRLFLIWWIKTIKHLWSSWLVHLLGISSLITVSFILFLFFILLIEVIHYIIIITITFFKDTLNHALSIGVLHGLLSIFHAIIRVIRFSLTIWFVLSLSTWTSACTVLMAAYLVLLLKGNSMSSIRWLSKCIISIRPSSWRLLQANRIFFSILLILFT